MKQKLNDVDLKDKSIHLVSNVMAQSFKTDFKVKYNYNSTLAKNKDVTKQTTVRFLLFNLTC